MAELFDNQEKFISDITATLPDYRRKIEVIYPPDIAQAGDAVIEGWLNEMFEPMDDPKEITSHMEHGDPLDSEGEEYYTIRERPPMDKLARSWVVFESVASKEDVHHCYSVASLIISKN